MGKWDKNILWWRKKVVTLHSRFGGSPVAQRTLK